MLSIYFALQSRWSRDPIWHRLHFLETFVGNLQAIICYVDKHSAYYTIFFQFCNFNGWQAMGMLPIAQH